MIRCIHKDPEIATKFRNFSSLLISRITHSTVARCPNKNSRCIISFFRCNIKIGQDEIHHSFSRPRGPRRCRARCSGPCSWPCPSSGSGSGPFCKNSAGLDSLIQEKSLPGSAFQSSCQTMLSNMKSLRFEMDCCEEVNAN
jgi:hypothetical protein